MNEHLADLVVDHYERHAREWDADRRALPWVDRTWIDLFAGLLPSGGTVLDIGSGGGDPVATSLVARGPKLTGVDSSSTLISLCRERMPTHRWMVGDMRRLSLGERFDGVLAWDSFFHLKPDDQTAMFDVFAAHAASGAVLMFNTGAARGPAIGTYRGDRLYHASRAGDAVPVLRLGVVRGGALSGASRRIWIGGGIHERRGVGLDVRCSRSARQTWTSLSRPWAFRRSLPPSATNRRRATCGPCAG